MPDFFKDYILSELRCARMRAKLLIMEIDTIGIAVRRGIMDPESALEALAEANALDFLRPTPPAHDPQYVGTERWPS